MNEKALCSGLQTATGQVPLKGVRIEARIAGMSSEVTVTQRYCNEERVDLEAVYVFPLEEGAAVSGFRARVGDRLIVGRVEERDKAFELYDDAMARGDGAFLLDQERPNIFTVSVGNLKPGQEVEVSLTYVALLNLEGPAIRFMLPTTVAPRYVPQGPPEVGEPDGDRVNPAHWFEVPYGLTLRVEIDLGAAIRSVESPSHAVRTELGGERATVTLASRAETLDRDFVLLVEPASAHKPMARAAKEPDGTRVVMVTFAPGEADLPRDARCEVDFVLDCSGSMGGSSIEEARRALELCLRGMSEGDTFNIVFFGSSFRQLWPQPRPYKQENLDEAVAAVRRCDAGMGGTEILSPMKAVLDQPVDPGRPRQVLLLTDGEVSNEAEVIALCQERARTARVFAFGIGHGASEHLVRGVARASRGAAEFIYPGERIEAKVLRMFGRVHTPVLDEVRLDWGGLRVEQAPAEVPPVFAGDALTVFARVTGGSGSVAMLKLKDRILEVPLDLERADAAGPVPVLWARTRIEDLEAGRGRARGSNQARGRGEDRTVAQIVELSCRYGLMSSHTSFVAVEERTASDRTTAQAELRRVPVALTRGWGGHGIASSRSTGTMAAFAPPSAAPMPMPGAPSSRMRRAAPMAMSPGAPPPPPAQAQPRRSGLSAIADAFNGIFKDSAKAKKAVPCEAEDSSPAFACEERPLGGSGFSPSMPSTRTEAGQVAQGPSSDPVFDLLLTQKADGSFLLSPVLLAWLGPRADRVREAAQQQGEALVATAVVVALLAAEAAPRRAEWKLAADKAQKWLARQPVTVDGAALI